MIRGITGIGEGHGPFISIHDGFVGVDSWADFLPGSDRIMLDTHRKSLRPFFRMIILNTGAQRTLPLTVDPMILQSPLELEQMQAVFGRSKHVMHGARP